MFPPHRLLASGSRFLAPAALARAAGPLLLGGVVVANAVWLAPELRIGRVPVNDVAFHRAAAERMAAGVQRGEPFLDPWVSEWSLGYPVWRSYQPLPHVVAGLALWAAQPLAGGDAAFAALLYLLIVTLPVSIYVGARLLGLSRAASGLASLLALAASSDGELGRYGIGYGAMVWRGSGLYTQVVALHVGVLAIGATVRTLDTRRHAWLASLLLALTALSHVVFGYVGFATAALLAIVGPSGRRGERLARLAVILGLALLLLAWFVVPLVAGHGIVNRSRWEAAHKWDSFGAPYVLRELVSGRLLDFGRPPLMTALVGLGALGAMLSLREAVARRLLALSALWLALFFGRETWGHLLLPLAVPSELHLHRLQAAFELSAVLLAAFGLTRLLAWLSARDGRLGLAAGAGVALALAPIARDRMAYLELNAAWGEANVAAYEHERADLEAAIREVQAVLAERPGRASAGLATTWGGAFKVGSAPVYSFLTREHVDQASFLYHAMSKTSDVMVVRNESDAAHDAAFAVRAVLAPADRGAPPHLRRRAVHGRFAVHESSPEGYFGLVDVGGHYTGPPSTHYEPSAAWLGSPLLRQGVVLSLDPDPVAGPAVGRWESLPPPRAEALAPRGRIVSEGKVGETYRAQVELDRSCHVLLKVTWSPDLQARVDGRRQRLVHVTPGFGAVAVPPGRHEVEVSYDPGPLKPAMLLAGIGLFLAGCGAMRARPEAAMAAALSGAGRRLCTPRRAAAAVIALSAMVALRPLFRGALVAGHDATAYPPRLVEMEVALSDGHFPPIWAADLGAGHGQPLFEFAPPLVYVAALPLRALGLGLADSLQLGLAILFLAGAAACYRVGRRLGVGRWAAVAGAVAWLFGPYVALDLFVRVAYAEAAALAVVPLALSALLWVAREPGAGRIALAGAAVALLPLGHNAVALLAVPALAVVMVLGGAASAGIAAIVAGLGLSAYFWLPALLEKGFVQTDRLREGFLHWSAHLVSPGQLLWSPWGYGLSGPGDGDGMSFALGLSHVALAMAGLVVALRHGRGSPRRMAIAFATAAVAGAWLATPGAASLWSRLETLQYLAYPWRALLLPAVFLPLVAVFAFDRAGPRATAFLTAALVLAGLARTEPRGYLRFDDEYYAPRSIAAKGINTTTREEYEPRWVRQRPPYDPRALFSREVDIAVTELAWRSHRREYLVAAAAPTLVDTSTFFYPGWTVAIDGTPVRVWPAPTRGTMAFQMPAGEHRVVLELAQTGARRAGSIVTATTAALLALASAVAAVRRMRRRLAPLATWHESPGNVQF